MRLASLRPGPSRLEWRSPACLLLLFLGILFATDVRAQGEIQWIESLQALGLDKPKSTAIDPQGNVYFLGFFWGDMAQLGGQTMTNPDFTQVYLAKFTATGNLVWLKTFDGKDGNPGTGLDILNAFITTDRFGNVFYCGGFRQSVQFGFLGVNWSPSTDPEENSVLVKFNKFGEPQWLQTTRHGDVVVMDMATDKQGNCYVTGFLGNAEEVHFDGVVLENSSKANPNLGSLYSDFYIAKYSPNGQVLWVFQSRGDGREVATGLATDPQGNVWVTGDFAEGDMVLGADTLSYDNNPNFDQGFLAKLDPEGTVLWTKDLNRLSPRDIGTDGFGSGYVTGMNYQGNVVDSTVFPVSQIDLFLFKTNPDGRLEWATGVKANKGILFHHLATDRFGNGTLAAAWANNVLITDLGSYYLQGSYDIFLMRTDHNGHLRWLKTLSSDKEDRPQGLAVADNGGYSLCGFFYGSLFQADSFLLTNPDGNPETFLLTGRGGCTFPERWTEIREDPGNGDGFARLHFSTGDLDSLELTWLADSTFQILGTGDSISGMASGVYYVLIHHKGGCSVLDTITIPLTVGVQPASAWQPDVRPLPVTGGYLILSLDRADCSVTLRDMHGKIWQQILHAPHGECRLELGAMPGGMYLLEIRNATTGGHYTCLIPVLK